MYKDLFSFGKTREDTSVTSVWLAVWYIIVRHCITTCKIAMRFYLDRGIGWGWEEKTPWRGYGKWSNSSKMSRQWLTVHLCLSVVDLYVSVVGPYNLWKKMLLSLYLCHYIFNELQALLRHYKTVLENMPIYLRVGTKTLKINTYLQICIDC